LVGDPTFPSDEERAAGEFELSFACLFCGREVAEDSPEGCELTAASAAGFAAFSAHIDCLRAASHDPEVFPDLVTRAEAPHDDPFSTEDRQAWAELDEVLAEIEQAERGADATRRAVAELRRISAWLYAE
jgi:hypothetical protein